MSDPLINLEAEQELLGSLMRDGGSVDGIADILTQEDFADPVHARLFAAIVREASLGKPTHPVALKGYFENDDGIRALGGIGYLARLTGNCTMLSTVSIARQLSELSQRRTMRAGLTTASGACADLNVTVGEIAAHADAAISQDGRDTIVQLTGGECLDELIRSFGDRQPGVCCHAVPSIDRLLGPMRPKQFIICAARPGIGKTATAISYALGAARAGHGVLFVSLEMSSAELAARMASDLCYDEGEGIPFGAIRDSILNDRQFQQVREAAAYLHRLPLHVVDTGNLAVGRLNALIRRHGRRMAAQGHKLELVIVDYIQLLRPDTNMRSSYEVVSEISRSLKAMAKDHGVAILGLAQLSREVEKRPDKRPQLSDLRDSGQIEQDADAVLFLTRQEYYHRLDEPDQNDPEWDEWNRLLNAMAGEIEFICAKRRNGTTGSTKGRFFGAFQAVRG